MVIQKGSEWDPEGEDDGESITPDDQTDDIETENINPAIPKSLWESMTWQTIREAFQISKTKEEAIKKVVNWNANNNPKLDENSLLKKVIWAFRHYDHDLR